MPDLRVNGKEMNWTDADFPATVMALLESLKLDPQTVVAEVSGEVVARAAFAETPLPYGATVEIVQLVGGG